MDRVEAIFVKKFIEPAAFLALAALAGSDRFIQYFPGASRGGLLMGATLSAGAAALFDAEGELCKF